MPTGSRMFTATDVENIALKLAVRKPAYLKMPSTIRSPLTPTVNTAKRRPARRRREIRSQPTGELNAGTAGGKATKGQWRNEKKPSEAGASHMTGVRAPKRPAAK